MPDDAIDRGSVFKQRRFLLAITFALFAFHYLRATLVPEFSAGFVKLEHSASRAEVGVALWLIWLWALGRYVQYECAFRNDLLSLHRKRVTSEACAAAATAAIQKGANEGQYESRGLMRGHLVEVGSTDDAMLQPFLNSNGWSFPTLTVRYRQGTEEWQWLDGGANCSFDTEETKALQRQIDQRLLLEYPHFTDFKVPYYLAALAPVSALIDFFRSIVLN